jgi:nucleotide-binding universal stress UspA family protein
MRLSTAPGDHAGVVQSLLLAYDGTSRSRRALEAAAEVASATGARVAVVSVIPVEPGRPVDPWDDGPTHRAQLREAIDLLAERGINAEAVAAIGNVGETVARLVQDGGYDAVVLGSTRGGIIGRLMGGTIARDVTRETQAMVILAG